MSEKLLQKHQSIPYTFFSGVIGIIPLIIAAMPFAIIYGAMAISTGLSEWQVMGMSLFVFAGASQFIAITLLTSVTAYPIILLTVFVVNLRHILYAASLMPQITKIPHWLRAPMAFWLTDESFAIVSSRLMKTTVNFTPHYLGAALTMYVNWIVFSWVGMTLGKNIPDITKWGLDVAMIVAFIGIVIPLLKKRADWACAVTAAISALLTYGWPHQTGLLFSSLLAIMVGMLVSTKQSKESL